MRLPHGVYVLLVSVLRILAVQLVDLHETGLTSHQELSIAQSHQKAMLKLAETQQRLG